MIEKTLVLSTAHLAPDTDIFLSEKKDIDIRYEAIRNVINHEYGYIFFLSTEGHVIKEMPELQPIIKWALAKGCTMLVFDRDADTMKHFQTYEW